MSPLIEIGDLNFSMPQTVIVDARGGPGSYLRYLAGHLNSAVFIDLDENLAIKPVDAASGGRHPLPDIHDFATLLGNLGITKESHVIVYDDKFCANSAARFWWMLRSIGHEQVQVINGGLQQAINKGIQLSTQPVGVKKEKPYPVSALYNGTVKLHEVESAAQDSQKMVIDVREEFRYLGISEPIDLIAGHIPGAVNLPYILSLGEDGRYLPVTALKNLYGEKLNGIAHDKVIVHCGSGVTACQTLLGMEYAGITGAKLYVGSWSEWSRNNLPIATKE